MTWKEQSNQGKTQVLLYAKFLFDLWTYIENINPSTLTFLTLIEESKLLTENLLLIPSAVKIKTRCWSIKMFVYHKDYTYPEYSDSYMSHRIFSQFVCSFLLRQDKINKQLKTNKQSTQSAGWGGSSSSSQQQQQPHHQHFQRRVEGVLRLETPLPRHSKHRASRDRRLSASWGLQAVKNSRLLKADSLFAKTRNYKHRLATVPCAKFQKTKQMKYSVSFDHLSTELFFSTNGNLVSGWLPL